MITIEEVLDELKTGKLKFSDIESSGLLCSVSKRIAKIKQPRWGYINIKSFEIIDLPKGTINDLYPNENVSPFLIGLAVDYLTRFMTGTPIEEVFLISLLGAKQLDKEELFMRHLSQIKGLDDLSIKNSIRLVCFDTVYRAGAQTYKPIEDINPDEYTISNVKIMVKRSLFFFENYGPKILDGLTFEGGYTGYIATGDGDFLTNDTLWDFKVSKYNPKPKATLQILVYWRMGIHSKYKDYYQNLKYLGIFNPRLDKIFRISVDIIPRDVIKEVEEVVIGY